MGKKQGDFKNEQSSFTESLCIEPMSVVFVTYMNQGFYERQTKDSTTSSWELWSEGGWSDFGGLKIFLRPFCRQSLENVRCACSSSRVLRSLEL